ncbi:F-box protein [Endozoicomonas sp. 4G]|uniref:F-box protein n=1 Tax=Endozoicomonas sp. 4G TaxID=2872754 RepID=UPI0020789D7D|nr:F-box protein [Endozoicomonas sp. 4G]
MDSPIDGTINAPFSYSGAPAGGSEQEASSRIVEIPDVTSKLRPSPTAITMPDKTRTVSTTDSATAITCYNRLVPLPPEVFKIIASYLSIEEINKFGQTSKTMRERLKSCSLEEVRYFLSQTRQRQASCRAIIQSSHLLLEYLRTLPLFIDRHFPAQLGPAIYSYYADHVRQQVIDGVALILKPIGSINVRRFDHHLRGHIPIIIERQMGNYSNILTPDHHGQWTREAVIEHGESVSYHHQYADHILFVPQPVPLGLGLSGPFSYQHTGKEHLLSIYERKKNGWVEQQLTTGDVFPEARKKFMHEMRLSPDAKSLVCINRGYVGAILGPNTGGQWVNKGKINSGCNHTQLFTADSKHLLVYDASYITVMSQADNGSWSETGDINVKELVDEHKLKPSSEEVSDSDSEEVSDSDSEKEGNSEFDLKVKFSPDNRHFAIWFEDAGENDANVAIQRNYFFVVIYAYDPKGQWYEQKRILEFCDQPTRYFDLKPRFSPDGRLLTISTEKSFSIWELNTNDEWQLSDRQESYGTGSIYFSVDPCEFIRRSGSSLTIWRKATSGTSGTSGMWGQTQTFPAESLVKVSPSGETIVCDDPAGHTDIYQRKPFAESVGKPFTEPDVQWLHQRLEFSIKTAQFNKEGCLLAVIPESSHNSLILLGLTADGSWQERARLQTEGSIESYCFSPCSRTLQVTSLRTDSNDIDLREVFSLWQIVPSTLTRLPQGRMT